ncbi:hypothetical protein Q3G72_030373 [Acer saccharum]|nr:hypothetical protein Q3G72_030373 [Acer saccharum]
MDVHGWPSLGYLDAIGVFVKPFEDLLCGSTQGILPSTTHKEQSDNWENPTRKELWGSNGGKEWNYQPNNAIIEIQIHHGGKYIDSISFKSKDGDGNLKKYGGNGGKAEPPFRIEWPSDYLSSISGTYRTNENKLVIQSLCFKTYRGLQYGPFGETNDIDAEKFDFSTNDWIIFGLFGRESTLIDAIGIYVKPHASNPCPLLMSLKKNRRKMNLPMNT